jgi:hypothetical protein
MPADPSTYTRAVPITRSKTYNYGEGFEGRGRNRSRYTAQQINEEDDSDDYHQSRDRRNRPGGRDQPVDQGYAETTRYAGYESGRQPSYSRRAAEPEQDRYAYYSGHSDSRPAMPTRESGYSTSAGSGQFSKPKINKNYSYEDAHYTTYQPPKSREGHPAYA